MGQPALDLLVPQARHFVERQARCPIFERALKCISEMSPLLCRQSQGLLEERLGLGAHVSRIAGSQSGAASTSASFEDGGGLVCAVTLGGVTLGDGCSDLGLL